MDEDLNSKFLEGRKIDWRTLTAIGILIIGYQIGLFLTSDFSGYNITDTIYLVGIGLVVVFSFIVAKEHNEFKALRQSSIFLGIAFLGLLAGDLAFYYYDNVLGVDPYPSPFDIGFLINNAGMIFFVLGILRFTKFNFHIKQIAVLVAIPVIITSAYATTAFVEWGEYEEISFDVMWGSIFTAGSSLVFAFTILGLSVYGKKSLNEIWLLLIAGFFLFSLADLWYYYLETFEEYYYAHTVNTMWVASFFLIIYSLILYSKKL